MEEAQGGTLQSYLKRHGRLSDRQMAILSQYVYYRYDNSNTKFGLIALYSQLFSGLEAMEKAQVVHRDIK